MKEVLRRYASSQREDARSFGANIRTLAREYGQASRENAHGLTVAIRGEGRPEATSQDNAGAERNAPLLAVAGVLLALALVAK